MRALGDYGQPARRRLRNAGFFLPAVVISAVTLLAGCAGPGMAFSGGPSPWLPGGAPGPILNAPAPATVPAPATAPRAVRPRG